MSKISTTLHSRPTFKKAKFSEILTSSNLSERKLKRLNTQKQKPNFLLPLKEDDSSNLT